MSEYRKLANQPLVFALAEFRFSPVFQIDQFIPQYQEAVRKAYPLPEPMQEHAIQVKGTAVDVSSRMKWSFVESSRHSAVVVDQERLIFITTAYPRFDGFAKSCMEALQPLKDIVDPDLLLRIGLRYGDLIRIGDGEKLEDYVDPYFGYPKLAEPLGTPEHQKDEVAIRTSIGRLLIRSMYGVNPLVCLPDLQGIPALPKPDAEPSHRIVLDFDHIWIGDGSARFDVGRIEDILDKLHEPAREAFWRITTDEAKEQKWS